MAVWRYFFGSHIFTQFLIFPGRAYCFEFVTNYFVTPFQNAFMVSHKHMCLLLRVKLGKFGWSLFYQGPNWDIIVFILCFLFIFIYSL